MEPASPGLSAWGRGLYQDTDSWDFDALGPLALDMESREGWCCRAMPEPLSDATRLLGERVRTRRESLGLSQEALAALCDVHWTFLGQVERGQRNLSLHNMLKIANGLQVDPAELVRGLKAPER